MDDSTSPAGRDKVRDGINRENHAIRRSLRALERLGLADGFGGTKVPMLTCYDFTTAKLMQEAGYSRFNKLTLSYAISGNPDSKRLAAVFQAMARQIYVDIRISVADYPTILSAMRQGRYQLGYAAWLADFDDASSFLDLLRSGSPGNYAGYRSAKFDLAMAKATGESNAARRARLLQEAEGIALADVPWLPVRFLSQSEAVGPRVGGYVQNVRDYNRSRWLWIK